MKLKFKFGPRRDGSYGKVMDYQIDEHGCVEVTDEQHIEFLLCTGNFEPADEVSEDDGGEGEMLIQNGEQTIDLMKLGKAELLTLANGEMGLKLSHKTGDVKLRAAIYEFVSKK